MCHPGCNRCPGLFGNPINCENLTRKRKLSGKGHPRIHRLPNHRRNKRHKHGQPGGRSSLAGDASSGNMNVNIRPQKISRINPERSCTTAGEAQCHLRRIPRLPHQIPGEDEFAMTRKQQTLYWSRDGSRGCQCNGLGHTGNTIQTCCHKNRNDKNHPTTKKAGLRPA